MSDLNDLEQAMLVKDTIYLNDLVNQDMFRYVSVAMAQFMVRPCPNPPIEIWISSRGGNAGIGFDIYDAIRTYPGHTTGIVKGFAYSAAANILQACTVRKVLAHTSLLYHNSTSIDVPTDTYSDPEKLEIHLKAVERTQRVSHQLVERRSNLTHDQVRALFKRNVYIYPEEALSMGLVDEIL